MRETARLTGMSESALQVAIHRGLKALATLIGDTQRRLPGHGTALDSVQQRTGL
ncbi:MAG: hypothetical protein ACLPXB_05940 [Thiobacillaceae bacterium]